MSKQILIETSARHLHLSEADVEALFGAGAKLTPKKDLSQPGQYACEERVDLVGPKNALRGVIVLGPCRTRTQVEVSLTDARALGCAAPVRESGDLAGSGALRLVGPRGEIDLKEGVIAAKRHVHMTPEDADALGLRDRQIVSLRADSPDRSLVFGDVVIRVSPTYATSAHIDTDEANAAGLSGEVYGEIVKD